MLYLPPAFSDELVKISKLQKVPIGAVAKKLYDKLVKGSPVKIRVTKDADRGGGGYFDWEKKEICVSDKDYEVLAHEVGHARVHEHFLGRLLQNVPARLAHFLSPTAGSVGGLLMANGKSWGLLLPTVLAAPTLLSEALASHTGDKLLEEAGITEAKKSRYRDRMRKAFGTYLSLPVVGTVIAAGLGLGSRHALRS